MPDSLTLGMITIAWAGIILLGTQTFFTLVTLPVKYDASERVRKLLRLMKANLLADGCN